MGTSKSHGGSGDRTPLLPDWAQPPNPEIPLPENAPADPPILVEPPALPPEFSWRRAKSSMTRFVTSGGDRVNLVSTGRNFSRAQGGYRRAATAARAGRTVTTNVGGFLANVANNGVVEALRKIGLRDVAGQPVLDILSAILNAISPAGASLEDNISRRAADAALLLIFEKFAVLEDGLERLNEMKADDVKKAFSVTVTEYIFQKWMLELGKRLEEGAISAHDAIRLEQIVKDYVVEIVRLDLGEWDILATDWSSNEAQGFIEELYSQAFNFLEVVQ